MSRLSKQHFWEWFKRHNKEYLELQSKSKKEAAYWLNELNAHVRAYFKFFEFGLTWEKNQPATLTITVHGKRAHFKKVDSFVATAPEIPGWNIQALEVPRPIDFMPEKLIEESGIHPRELIFSFINDDPDCKVIIVFHPLCTKENEWLISELAHTAVYNLLGERSYGLDIADLRVENLSYADPNDVYKLEELPDIIGSRKSSMTVDDKGNLLGMG